MESSVAGSTLTLPNTYQLSCGGDGNEQIFSINVPALHTLNIGLIDADCNLKYCHTTGIVLFFFLYCCNICGCRLSAFEYFSFHIDVCRDGHMRLCFFVVP